MQPQSETKIQPPIWCSTDLGLVDYDEAWQVQKDLVAARSAGRLKSDWILFLEHPPVFTLGRRGGADHLLVSNGFLQRRGVRVIQVERGGYITFHGPGQQVVYAIIDLKAAAMGVVELVNSLEEIMLRAVADWGIRAERKKINRGIWVGPKKMGSIGLAIRRGFSFHGLALNANVDLEPFGWVRPCGLEGVEMTSMQKEIGADICMHQLREVMAKHVSEVFHIELRSESPEVLRSFNR
jgi:lipoate-protein ligase B